MKIKDSHQQLRENQSALLNAITSHIQQLAHLYKKKNRDFFSMPWFLLIGATHAGKSQLMNQSDLNIEEQRVLPQGGELYVTAEALFIEMPGQWTSGDYTARLWVELIKCLRQLRQPRALDGILLVLDAAELAQHIKQQSHAKRIHHILHFISSSHRHQLPIHLLVTKIDQMKGFDKFFNDMSIEQQTLPWGFMLPATAQRQPMFQNYQKGFGSLLTRLQDRQLWCLQKAHAPEDIHQIIEFPLQMQAWQTVLDGWIQQVFTPAIIKLCPLVGIYLTSTMQQNQTLDMLSKNHPTLPSGNMPTSALCAKKPLFVKRLLSHTLIHHQPSQHTKKQSLWLWSHWRSITLSSVLLLSIGYYALHISHLVERDIHHLKQAQITLLSISGNSVPKIETGLSQDLSYLEKLNQAQRHLSNTTTPRFIQYIYPELKYLKTDLNNIYGQAIHQLFKPLVQTSLENLIVQTKNDLDKFLLFKAYLMLGNQIPMEQTFANHMLNQIWLRSKLIPLPEHIAQMNTASIKLHPMRIDKNIVHQIKVELGAIPQERLALIYLLSQFTQPLHDTPANFDLYHIPTPYKRNEFEAIYEISTVQACQKINHTHSLLSIIPVASIPQTECVSALRQNYSLAYKNWWQQSLNAYLPPMPRASASDDSSVSYLIKNHPKFMTRWQQLIEHTSHMHQEMSPTKQWFNRHVANAFTSWHQQTHHLQRLPELLTRLKHSVATVYNDISPSFKAFTSVQQYFRSKHDSMTELEKIHENLPMPVKTWIQPMLAGLWSQHLQLAQQYINQRWQHTILPFYHKKISARYPIEKKSQIDITLDDFAYFFAPHWQLNTFIAEHIEPFYDKHLGRWYPKTRFGKSLSLTNEVMAQILRGDLIKDMFFDKGALQVRFALKPMMPSLMLPTLFYEDGNPIQIGQKKIHFFNWPNDHKPRILSLSLPNEPSLLTKQGPWAWFKLIDEAHVTQQATLHDYLVTWRMDQENLMFQLTTEKKISPFLHHVLSQYHLPEALFPETG